MDTAKASKKPRKFSLVLMCLLLAFTLAVNVISIASKYDFHNRKEYPKGQYAINHYSNKISDCHSGCFTQKTNKKIVDRSFAESL